jgi:hypothetical protein
VDGVSSLRVGNIYGHGFNAEQRAALEASGFCFRSEVSTYAGSQLCSFLDFAHGPSLELIEVTDRGDYASFVPRGMEPYCPGISLEVEDGSPAQLDGFERSFADLEPYRLHVAYPDAALAEAAESPGWHYLNFARPVIPGAFVWLTAFDQPRPTISRRTAHPNGVRGVTALVFDGATRLDRVARLAGGTAEPPELGDVRLVTVDGSDAGRFPLRAVVLMADSLDVFGAQPRADEATRLLGRPVVRIATNPPAWDLWITTGIPRSADGPKTTTGLDGVAPDCTRKQVPGPGEPV